MSSSIYSQLLPLWTIPQKACLIRFDWIVLFYMDSLNKTRSHCYIKVYENRMIKKQKGLTVSLNWKCEIPKASLALDQCRNQSEHYRSLHRRQVTLIHHPPYPPSTIIKLLIFQAPWVEPVGSRFSFLFHILPSVKGSQKLVYTEPFSIPKACNSETSCLHPRTHREDNSSFILMSDLKLTLQVNWGTGYALSGCFTSGHRC